MSQQQSDDLWTNLALGAVAAVVGVGCVVWLAGTGTAVVTGNAPPRSFGEPWRLLASPADLAGVWGHAVGPAWLFWLLFVVLVAALIGGVAMAWSRFAQGLMKRRDPYKGAPETWPGLATRREVSRAAGPKTLLARAGVLRPGMVDAESGDVGLRLGTARGVSVWASVEDSVVIVGPPRSGKGLHLAIPAILDAPGAVITTGTRPDNIAPTLEARSAPLPDGRVRPVMIFDPQHLAAGLTQPGQQRWSLIAGCEDPQRAMSRARVLASEAGEGVENASFWAERCVTATRCLLHAAALGDVKTIELYEWALSATAARRAVEILRDSPGTAPGWTRALQSILDDDPRTRDNVWAAVSNTFSMLGDPRVLATVSPAPAELFDAAEFLRAGGTAYLLGTSSGAAATATLVAAFIDDVVETARALAARSVGFRLDPPLALILDEAANYPLAALPSLMSEGGGSGISTWVFVQSLAQARSQWGRERAESIWDSAIVKIVLGGGGQADDLSDLSRLLGNRREQRSSVSYGTRDSGRSWSESEEEKPVMEPSQLRRIPFGYALLVLRTATPIMLHLGRWTDRQDGKELQTQRATIETRMLEALS